VGTLATVHDGAKRILFVRAGALGDFILTLPTLTALRQCLPEAHLEILGYPSIAELALRSGLADSLSRVDDVHLAPLFAEETRLPDALTTWLRRFDVAVVVWRAAETLAIRMESSGIKHAITIEPAPPEGERIYAAEFMLRQLPRHLRGIATPIPRLHLPATDPAWAADYLRRVHGLSPELTLVVHPGSGGRGPNRNWPPERFAALVHRAPEELGLSPLLLCGPADEEFAAEVRRRVAVPVAQGLTVVQLAGLLCACRACVSNDSGVAHLAAALGTATVVIFGATDAAIWAPRGAHVRTLQGAPPRYAEIARVAVADVLTALRDLTSPPRRPRA